MIKTTWAIEILVVRITADVDEYDSSVDGGRSTVRELIVQHYVGGFPNEAGALETCETCAATIRAGHDFQYFTPAADQVPS